MSTATSAGADPTSKSIESSTEVIPTTMTGIDRAAAVAGTGGTAGEEVTGITEAAETTGEDEMTDGRTGDLPGPSCASSTCAAAKAAT